MFDDLGLSRDDGLQLLNLSKNEQIYELHTSPRWCMYHRISELCRRLGSPNMWVGVAAHATQVALQVGCFEAEQPSTASTMGLPLQLILHVLLFQRVSWALCW